MKSAYRIAVIPGDGIGPEVTTQAINTLHAASKSWGFEMNFTMIKGGAGYFKSTGREWDSDAFTRCSSADAILLGAIGLPGVRLGGETGHGSRIIFGLRKGLDLYANVRPARLYPGVVHRVNSGNTRVWENVDFVIVRENTEGLYNPVKGTLSRGGIDEMAIDTRIITRKGAERAARFAFKLSMTRNKGAPVDGKMKVTCVDKSNVLAGCRLFRDVFLEIGKEYPKVAKDCVFVDAFAMNLVREPECYDIVLTSNLMGDILSDLAASLQGGLGMAPSGNIGDNHAMFEPVHGSAPDIADRDIANPTGAILSSAMMLDWLGKKHGDSRLTSAAIDIESAVAWAVGPRGLATPDIGGKSSCSRFGETIAERVGMNRKKKKR